MGTVIYANVNGQLLSETRDGVRKVYIPDALGNTVAMMDSTGALTDTFDYFPSGTVSARTGTTPTPFQWVGGQGYYRDNSKRVHVRARNFYVNLGRWAETDPIGFNGGDYNLYRYVKNRFVVAIDPSGLICLDPEPFKNEWEIGVDWDLFQPSALDCCGKFTAKWKLKVEDSDVPSMGPIGKQKSSKYGFMVQKVVMSNNIEVCPQPQQVIPDPKEIKLSKSITYWEAWLVNNDGTTLPDYDAFWVSDKYKGYRGSVTYMGTMRYFPIRNGADNTWYAEARGWGNGCNGMSGNLPCTQNKPAWWAEGNIETVTTCNAGKFRADFQHSARVDFNCCKSDFQASVSQASPTVSKVEKPCK